MVEYDRATMRSRYGGGGECLSEYTEVAGIITQTTTHCGGQCFSEYTEVADLRTYKAIGCKPPPANGDYYTLSETPNGCQTDRNGYRTMCLCASNNCNKPDLSPVEPGPA